MVPISVLDLAIVADGHTSADALADTTALAQVADELGCLRFWVAEHHNMSTVTSTVPAVLIAHIADHTDNIRVGSGGVMLPNHAPLAIAEQFAMLEALHPNRIDLGIGRAPGADQHTAMAFGRDMRQSVESFPRDVVSVMGLLGDPRGEDGVWNVLSATPVASSYPMVCLLGSSDYSAQLAAMLGIPFAYAHHFDTGLTDLASQLYLDNFRPSTQFPEPYLIVSVGALTANTDEEAEYLSLPGRLLRLGIRTGRLLPLLTPDAAAAHPEADEARRLPTEQVVGSPERITKELSELVERTGANELMVTATTYDVKERQESLRLLTSAWA